MSTIEDKLKAHKTNTQTHLLQLHVDPLFSKGLDIVSKHYKIPRAEYIRRCLSLCLASIQDPKLLDKLDKVVKI